MTPDPKAVARGGHAEMSEWRPIETAPREMWVVIGKANWKLFPKAKFGPYGSGEHGSFDGWLFEDEFASCVVPNIDGGPFLGWQEDVDDGMMPTHWMPLPAEKLAKMEAGDG